MPEPPWGSRVLVPVGPRRVVGVAWGNALEIPPVALREVFKVLDSEPLLPRDLGPFLEWIARYYFYPLGLVVAEAVPPGLLSARAKRVGQIASGRGTGPRRPLSLEVWPEGPVGALSPEQKTAVVAVTNALAQGAYRPFLLHGVTGSGKTEVYLQAAAACLEQGRAVLVLVPEIAMTNQAVGWFVGRFADAVTVLHSGLTEAERRQQWWRVRQGHGRIVIGTRSAVFAPASNLGLIVVDEEHDPSYKQEEKLRYQARDLAVLRANLDLAVVLLGSATPAVTSYHNALLGRYELLRMACRVEGRALPEIHVVDRRGSKAHGRSRGRGAKAHKPPPPWLSDELHGALIETLDRGEQAVLFVNRRGFATYLFCAACGFIFRCPRCEVALTWHRGTHSAAPGRKGRLVCHYCGLEEPAMPVCPSCGGDAIRATGWGTERVAYDLQQLFPTARIARLDRDAAKGRQAVDALLRSVRAGVVDILVGTQMVTKGHDLPEVTLVGVLWADLSLNFPEYHAAERTFQLLAQVAGRAGRGERQGRGIVQTWLPHHYALRCAKHHDFTGFFETETALRKRLGYPPFGRLINLRVSGPREDRVAAAAAMLADTARRLLDLGPEGKAAPVDVLGPAQALRARLCNRYRWQVLLKGSSAAALHDSCAQILSAAYREIPSGVRLDVDVDPQSLL